MIDYKVSFWTIDEALWRHLSVRTQLADEHSCFFISELVGQNPRHEIALRSLAVFDGLCQTFKGISPILIEIVGDSLPDAAILRGEVERLISSNGWVYRQFRCGTGFQIEVRPDSVLIPSDDYKDRIWRIQRALNAAPDAGRTAFIADPREPSDMVPLVGSKNESGDIKTPLQP